MPVSLNKSTYLIHTYQESTPHNHKFEATFDHHAVHQVSSLVLALPQSSVAYSSMAILEAQLTLLLHRDLGNQISEKVQKGGATASKEANKSTS